MSEEENKTAEQRVVSVDHRFKIDEYGRIFKNGKEHKSFPSGGDYLTVIFHYPGNIIKHHQVSRLTAVAFVPNPANLKYVDHIDGDRRNNHYSNLRWVTKNQNQYNTRKMKEGKAGRKCSSKYKGVSICQKSLKWRARIAPKNRKEVALGRFDTEEEAALAYNKAALMFFGEHACVNEIE
jgi:hypothetical protein